MIDTTTTAVLKIALVSDTHYHFEDLEDAIDDINHRGDATFVVATGDITENGLKKEFEIFHDVMARLSVPYLTVIGNHDYLANGGEVYRLMYGDFNYQFAFQGISFVMFDNVIWESNKAADYEWLEHAMSESAESDETSHPLRHKIIFSHIPPFDGQLEEKRDLFHSLLRKHGASISIHGHRHEYFNDDLMGDGLHYVTVGSPEKRSYAVLTVTNDSVTVEQIHF